MKREKRQTKREKKEHGGGGGHQEHGHIHCIACGRHIDPKEFEVKPATAMVIVCAHSSQFPCCTGCKDTAQYLVDEHDRTNKPVNHAPAVH